MAVDATTSSSEMAEERAAKKSRAKKTRLSSGPAVSWLSATGMLTNTRPGPADGSRSSNEKMTGKMIMHAARATKVSMIAMANEDPGTSSSVRR